MKVLFLIPFVCLVAYSHASLARGVTPEDKREGHPDQCWVEGIDYLGVGEKKSLPNECAVVTCEKDGEYEIARCGTVSVDPPCVKEEGDLSEPYPKCCYTIVCPSKK